MSCWRRISTYRRTLRRQIASQSATDRTCTARLICATLCVSVERRASMASRLSVCLHNNVSSRCRLLTPLRHADRQISRSVTAGFSSNRLPHWQAATCRRRCGLEYTHVRSTAESLRACCANWQDVVDSTAFSSDSASMCSTCPRDYICLHSDGLIILMSHRSHKTHRPSFASGSDH